MSRIDWAGRWFKIGAELGNSDAVTFYSREAPGGPLREKHFLHRERDGFGVVMRTLHEEGYQFQAPSRPQQVPSKARLFVLFLRALFKHPSPRRIPWRHWHPTASAPRSHQIGFMVLDTAMEENLERHCNKAGVNDSAYLLALISGLIQKNYFRDPLDTALWMLPVNMRGAFPEVSWDENCVSFIPLHVPTAGAVHQTARLISAELRTALKRGDHWGFYELYQIGRWIGEKGMRFLSRRSRRKSFWTGTYTTLGSWDDPTYRNDPLAKRLWLFAPPGSINYPVGITVMKWFGVRVVTLKLHPAITEGDLVQEANQILAQVRVHFKESTASPAMLDSHH